MSYREEKNGYVVRLEDGAWIPPVASNADWKDYQAWRSAGNEPDAAREAEPERRLVRKSLIVQRLHEAKLLTAAQAALNADPYARERWYAADRPAIYADDPEAVALLIAIGADPQAILAP